jgi:hypothetical protein
MDKTAFHIIIIIIVLSIFVIVMSIGMELTIRSH